MAQFMCPQCGARAQVMHTGQQSYMTSCGEEFHRYCFEVHDALKHGKSADPGKCRVFQEALRMALANGQL